MLSNKNCNFEHIVEISQGSRVAGNRSVGQLDILHMPDAPQIQWSGAVNSLGYDRAIQTSRMTFGFFVESKFIPEHVEHKTLAGRTHYQAILKHLLRPETVNGIFNPGRPEKTRLKSVPDWPYIDDVRLCDMSAEHVRRLVSAAFAHEYSPQTVKHIKNVAFAIISHAQREGCFDRPNPVGQVRLPRVAEKTERRLTIDQTRAMLELMGSPEKEIALTTITTGMNILEICNLQWKYVNLTHIDSYVDGEIIPGMNISITTRWNRDGLGGGRNRKRNIEIPGPLISTLETLSLRAGNPGPGDFVFAVGSSQPLSPARLLQGRLKPIGKKLGLPWLSWRVLGRAHTTLLSEFRSQLNNQMELKADKGANLAIMPAPLPATGIATEKSATIERRLMCRSFRFGRRSRENTFQ